MGKGDKKSKKGKISKDSYGNSRSRKALKAKLKRTASRKSPSVAVSETEVKPKRTSAKKKTDA